MTTVATRLADPLGFIQYAEAQEAWALVRQQYPELPAAVFGSEPGTVPNASVYTDRLAHINFNGTQMWSPDFWHETGHIIEWMALIARFADDRCWAATVPPAIFPSPDNTVLRDYWLARGLPGVFTDHLDGVWAYLAWECFADSFMTANIAQPERTFANGTAFNKTAMLAWFRELGSETVAKWISGDTPVDLDTNGNGHVVIPIPPGALVAGRPTIAVPQRIGLAGTESKFPQFGYNLLPVNGPYTSVDVYVRNDFVHPGTAWIKVAVIQS